jgi:hypothetical protein
VKARDLAILGAVVAIGVFAAMDAVRGGREPAPRAAEEPPQPPALEAPPERPADVFLPVPAPGSLVYTSADDCRVHAVAVPSGIERPLPRLAGDCALWAAPTGTRIAYGLDSQGPDSLATASFRLVDLERPRVGLGGYRALFGVLIWTRDGSRAAWCGESGTGFDLSLGGPARRLGDCPSAFTPDGRVAFAQGDRLLVEDEVVLRTRGQITYARWGANGSLAIVVDGERVERWLDGSRTHVLDLPPRVQGRVPGFSPDNCAALFATSDRVELIDLGCFGATRRERRAFAGGNAAWSPDGEWIAVAEQATIAFHRVVGPREVIRWLAAADELAWQG